MHCGIFLNWYEFIGNISELVVDNNVVVSEKNREAKIDLVDSGFLDPNSPPSFYSTFGVFIDIDVSYLNKRYRIYNCSLHKRT